MAKIAILGTGAFGTALASILIENKHHVMMWGIDKNEIADLKKAKNEYYFGDKKMPAAPKLVTNNFLRIALQNPEYILIAVPSSFLIETLLMALKKIKCKPIIINVAKGLDPLTDDVWSKSILKNVQNNIGGLVALTGPSFAKETFYKYPTIVNVISSSFSVATKVSHLFNNNHFKCVIIKDEIGGQVLGAFKNIIAIGMGIVYQLYDSSNTRAAMLSQGAKEIINIVKVLHGDVETLSEFCGIGDIYLTCTDVKSRNFLLGKTIVENGITRAIEISNKTVEGYAAVKIAYGIIKKHKLKSPFIEGIYNVLYESANCKLIVKNVINEL